MNYGKSIKASYSNDKQPYTYVLSWVVAVINLLIIIFYKKIDTNQYVIGMMLIITSVLAMVHVRNAKMLFVLISIIAYVNISIAVIDCFYGGEMFNKYQWELRHSIYNQIYAKSILMNITIISLMITPRTINRAVMASRPISDIQRKKNPIIAYVGIAFIIYSLIFGVTRSVRAGYTSNQNPLYEYAIMLFIIVWYYCRGMRLADILLKACALVYIVQGLYYGDRSSALLLLALIVMAVIKKIPIIKMLLLSVGGIVVANIIAVVRDMESLNAVVIIQKAFSKGVLTFFSDTASQSFYTGTTIVATRTFADSPLYYVKQFMISIFVGGGSPLANDSILTEFSSQYYSTPGGGIYPSYFYFWGGFIGVAIGAVIIGLVIKIIFTKKSPIYIFMTYLITVMSLRWYLYAPLPLFRMSILIFCVLYLICEVFDAMVRSQEYSIKYAEKQ